MEMPLKLSPLASSCFHPQCTKQHKYVVTTTNIIQTQQAKMDQSKYSDDSMTSTNTIVAFDLYGTLLNTASIAAKLSEHFGKDKGPDLAAKWRVYQLEYTWRLNSMGMSVLLLVSILQLPGTFP